MATLAQDACLAPRTRFNLHDEHLPTEREGFNLSLGQIILIPGHGTWQQTISKHQSLSLLAASGSEVPLGGVCLSISPRKQKDWHTVVDGATGRLKEKSHASLCLGCKRVGKGTN